MECLQANPYTVQGTIVEGGEAICVLNIDLKACTPSVVFHHIVFNDTLNILGLRFCHYKRWHSNRKPAFLYKPLAMSVTYLFERWKHKSGYTRSHFGVLHNQTKLVPIDLGLRIATITTWCTDDNNDNIEQEYLQPSEMASETRKSTLRGITEPTLQKALG